MYKLEPNDIQAMLADAARVLTQPNDREVMRRLVCATRATEESEWDKRLIATMLAKAGKMHEAEIVANDIAVTWQKAEALWSMGKVLLEDGDRQQALGLLHQAALSAQSGQLTGSAQDRLDASAVLSDIAATLGEHGEAQQAEAAAAAINDEQRRQTARQRLAELQDQTETSTA